MTKIDCTKDWTFIFPEFIPIETDVKLIEKNKEITFNVPYGSNGIEIVLKLPERGSPKEVISGTYKILDQANLKGNITFRILENGKRLEGEPQYFAGSRTWVIIRKD